MYTVRNGKNTEEEYQLNYEGYLATVRPGSKQTYSRMLYRRLRLIVPKPVSEMTGKELEKIWIWLKKEYGGK